MFCPSDADVSGSIAALRPRGAAWRNGGHDAIAGSTMGDFFDAFGEVAGETDRRICALVDEYFCSTAVETLDLWALEYSVPDGCDPFADVCEKVNAIGDSVPTYAEAAARDRGWSISIVEEFVTSVEDGSMGMGLMGTMLMGAESGVAWTVTIDLAASPSYSVPLDIEPLMGLMLMGDGFNCGPDIAPLVCLLRRIAPGHADLIFQTIN